MNLDQLRKQAKELVKAARARDGGALARLGDRDEPKLADAQRVLAREHGYASWAALVQALEASEEAFVRAAIDGRRARAEALLAACPELEQAPWARLVLGLGWDGDPGAPGGPLGWTPLLYVCHSCFASPALARELLDRGADPNSCFVNEHGRMSALYGAAGRAHDPELTRLLLARGADPDDGESLYHACEADTPECLRLLLGAGAETRGTNALAHALDFEHTLEHVRALLEAGADANERAHVAQAVRRGRGPDFVRLLAEHGADVDRPGGETWRGPVPLRSPYRHAVLRNRPDVANALAELGADTSVQPEDLAVAAVARGERPSSPLPDELDPDAQEVLVLAALEGRLDAVVEAVGVGFEGVVGGSPAGTLLHHAAWVGDAALVRRLLQRGADAVASSPADFSTPLAWLVLNSPRRPGAVEAAELLAAAGNPLEPRFLDAADGPLAAWVEERLAGDTPKRGSGRRAPGSDA